MIRINIFFLGGPCCCKIAIMMGIQRTLIGLMIDGQDSQAVLAVAGEEALNEQLLPCIFLRFIKSHGPHVLKPRFSRETHCRFSRINITITYFHMYMYMYVYMDMYMYMYMCTYVYMSICLYVCVYIYRYIYIYMCMYIYICICTYTYIPMFYPILVVVWLPGRPR